VSLDLSATRESLARFWPVVVPRKSAGSCRSGHRCGQRRESVGNRSCYPR